MLIWNDQFRYLRQWFGPQPLEQASGASNAYDSHHSRLYMDTDAEDVCASPSAMHTLLSTISTSQHYKYLMGTEE